MHYYNTITHQTATIIRVDHAKDWVVYQIGGKQYECSWDNFIKNFHEIINEKP